LQNFKTLFLVFLLFSVTLSLFFVLKADQSEISASHPLERKHFSLQRERIEKPSETLEDKMYFLGKFDPAQENNFVEIDSKYAKRQGLFLRSEAYEAFVKMHTAALKDGVQLTIVSATRNFDYQKFIWERKWSGKSLVEGKNLAKSVSDPVERAKIILRFSSMPGTSRHHWGTDIDLNALNNDYFLKGEGEKIYAWLTENASDYGFCQTYTPKNSTRSSGYEEEKWHWSYLPLSRLFLTGYTQQVKYADLKGFLGWETAKELCVIKNYVLSINTECR
jgi:LAS superfamily LD-carboxypeptidase LdcB